jgi:microcystin-dependent protein
MTYQVTFTDSSNPTKVPIKVLDQQLNTDTSLAFVGQNYPGYAKPIAEDLLHLLENFASPQSSANVPASVALSNPVQGQLWYNTTSNTLLVYDGTTWTPAGSLKKGSSRPSVANSLPGDLWADTVNQQLYIFSGSNWLLVGPQFSAGTLTGPQVETITDTTNTDHSVVTLYSNNNRIAIISKESFSPKSVITGFNSIKQGITLTSVGSTDTTNPTRFNGTATSADGLLVNGSTVPAASFLRGDALSIGNFPLNIRSDGGITVGSNLSFNIGTTGNSTILYNKVSGSPIQFNLINNGLTSTALYIDATNKVGIGYNNTNISTVLDVKGSLKIKDDSDNSIAGQLIITGTNDVNAIGGASISTTGGATIAKGLAVDGDISAKGLLHFTSVDTNGNQVAGSVMLPSSDAAAGLYDIGTSARPFRNIYANSFVGRFNGDVIGNITGQISGSASKLASPTVFSLTGDVTSNSISFDGQTETGTVIFNTLINQGIITSKTSATDSVPADTLLVYRPNVGLLQMTKQILFNHIATIPAGAIFPYAGNNVPAGYLLCDGSEVLISDYPLLFSVINYLYRPQGLLIGYQTFALPDLRGRFPLGRDDMSNGGTVPSSDGSGTLVSAGGGQASRVSQVTARTTGGASGTQSITVSQTNLPDHQHTLSDSSGQYYTMPGNQSTGASDTNASANIQVSTSTATAYGLGRTGSVTGVSQLGASIETMNPYQTINYIIFTGVI